MAQCAVSFQMIAHLNNFSEFFKLHTGKAADGQLTASIEVENTGTYQVTILAIEEERGIIDSFIEYSGQWTVGGTTISDVFVTTTDITATSDAILESNTHSGPNIVCFFS